jgi:hypothetical protein
MKRVLLILAFVLFVACGSPMQIQEYRGQDVFEGQGGTVENFNGVDFWTSGTPNCKFKLLGIIDYSSGTFGFDALSRVVFVSRVKEYGGDGVILVRQDNRPAGFSSFGNPGQVNIDYSKDYRYAVVKYLK